jgi:hypothetical protein
MTLEECKRQLLELADGPVDKAELADRARSIVRQFQAVAGAEMLEMLAEWLDSEHDRHEFTIVEGSQLETVNRRLAVFGTALEAIDEDR